MAIASLLIKLGADISELDTKMPKAAGAVDGAARSFTGLNREVLAAETRLAKMSVQVGSTATATKGLGAQMQTFDGILAAAGVNIGAEVRGLKDLGDAAGKTATEIGALGTAGLAVGAAIGGWKIGRMVADFFGLDETIGNATAKLLHFGDVAAQTAGAKADVLARATKNAGREITDYTEAININIAALDKHTAKLTAAAATAKAAAEARAAWLKSALAQQAADDKALAAVSDKLFGRDLITRANTYATALGGVENIVKLMPDQQTALNDTFFQAFDALRRAGRGADELAQKYFNLATATNKLTTLPGTLIAAPTVPLPPALDLPITDEGTTLGPTQVMDEWAAAAEKANKQIVESTDAASSSITNNFIGAFQQISQGVDVCAQHIASVFGAVTQTDAYRKAGIFVNEGFGTASRINQNALRGIGVTRSAEQGLGATVPGMAGGGPMSVVVNAPGAWGLDTPAGRRQLGEVVGQAVMGAYKRSGGRA